MATTNLALNEPVYASTGWDVSLNNNFTALDGAFGNIVSKTGLTSVSITLTGPNSTSNSSGLGETQSFLIKLAGTLTANINLVFPTGISGRWTVRNGTSGSFTVTAKTASVGATVVLPQTFDTSIVSDGTNIYLADDGVLNSGTNASLGTLATSGAVTASGAITSQGTASTAITALQASTSAPANLVITRTRGTIAAPATVATSDVLGNLNFQGYGGTNTRLLGQVSSTVDTYTSDTNISSYLSLSTSSSGAAAATEKFRIGSAGQLGIGGATYGTSGQVLKSGGASAAPTWGLTITSGTSVAMTGLTSTDFTSLPSTVKRITVMIYGVALNSTSNPRVQFLTGTNTPVTSLYAGVTSYIQSSSAGGSAFLTGAGFDINNFFASTGNIFNGKFVLENLSGNTWICTATGFTSGSAYLWEISGNNPVTAVVTGIRLTSVSGTAAYTAGSVNILYE
jgi:hypothetical protein